MVDVGIIGSDVSLAEDDTLDAIIRISSVVGMPEDKFVDHLPEVVVARGERSHYDNVNNVITYGDMSELAVIYEESAHFLHLNPGNRCDIPKYLSDKTVPFADKFFPLSIVEAFGFFSFRLVDSSSVPMTLHGWKRKSLFYNSFLPAVVADDLAQAVDAFCDLGLSLQQAEGRSSAVEMLSKTVGGFKDNPYFGYAFSRLFHLFGYHLGDELFSNYSLNGDIVPVTRLLELPIDDCFDFYRERLPSKGFFF